MTHFEKEDFEKENKEEDIKKSKIIQTKEYSKEEECHDNNNNNKHLGIKLNVFQKFLAVAVILQLVLSFYIVMKLPDASSLSNTGSPSGLAVAAPPSQQAAAPRAAVVNNPAELNDDDTIKGDKNAPVTIVEFSDFECPFCVRFYEQTLSQIDSAYIKTGKVKLIYRDFPLGFHANAQKAAEAAECAGEQGKYWEMHNILFEKGVQSGVESFKGYAKELSLDSKKFNSCLDESKMANEVKKDQTDGAKFGVSGTPAFFINGQLLTGAQPFKAFQSVIDAELAKTK
ncbi:DsbA family protein [Candidatus Woesearchaeota archaeon]|nr:DsbA family protein [Candidatus Woesearchaeota archaeon]